MSVPKSLSKATVGQYFLNTFGLTAPKPCTAVTNQHKSQGFVIPQWELDDESIGRRMSSRVNFTYIAQYYKLLICMSYILLPLRFATLTW